MNYPAKLPSKLVSKSETAIGGKGHQTRSHKAKLASACYLPWHHYLFTLMAFIVVPRVYVRKHLNSLICRRTIVTHISPTTSLLRSDTSDNEVYLLGTVSIFNLGVQYCIALLQLVSVDVLSLTRIHLQLLNHLSILYS